MTLREQKNAETKDCYQAREVTIAKIRKKKKKIAKISGKNSPFCFSGKD